MGIIVRAKKAGTTTTFHPPHPLIITTRANITEHAELATECTAKDKNGEKLRGWNNNGIKLYNKTRKANKAACKTSQR